MTTSLNVVDLLSTQQKNILAALVQSQGSAEDLFHRFGENGEDINQFESVLSRLERVGLVSTHLSNGADGDEIIVYAVTKKGKELFPTTMIEVRQNAIDTPGSLPLLPKLPPEDRHDHSALRSLLIEYLREHPEQIGEFGTMLRDYREIAFSAVDCLVFLNTSRRRDS